MIENVQMVSNDDVECIGNEQNDDGQVESICVLNGIQV